MCAVCAHLIFDSSGWWNQYDSNHWFVEYYYRFIAMWKHTPPEAKQRQKKMDSLVGHSRPIQNDRKRTRRPSSTTSTHNNEFKSVNLMSDLHVERANIWQQSMIKQTQSPKRIGASSQLGNFDTEHGAAFSCCCYFGSLL